MTSPRLALFLLLAIAPIASIIYPLWAEDKTATTLASASTNEPPNAIYDSQAVDQPRLSPEETIKTSKLPEGFRMQVAAKSPDIRQPIGMCWDSRGRLWVVENYTYAERALNFDESLNDRILIFEDTDQDGTLDSRKVFWDQGKRLTSIEIGYGGVWALAAPHLLFIPDQDFDDVPDSQPQIVLDGFEHQAIRHNLVNGLRWGPDGWLYGRHGIQAVSKVGPPGVSDLERKSFSCCIWRWHPIRKKMEVVCEGTTNSWGFDWDKHGQLFFINTVIGHLWHAIPGAHLQRMSGDDLDSDVYELMPQVADHVHFDSGKEVWSDIRNLGVTPTTDALGGGHAHSGMMIYQGDQWPAEYRDKLYTLNFHGRRINVERLDRHGAGFVGRHEPDMVLFSDPWFRGIELSTGPDGSVWVLDWSDVGECHENDGVHRNSGTIYRIAYGPTQSAFAFKDLRATVTNTVTVAEAASVADAASVGTVTPSKTAFQDLRAATDAELLEWIASSNIWLARQSRLILSERSVAGNLSSSVIRDLLKIVKSDPSDQRRLTALWTLMACGKDSSMVLKSLLLDASEHVRIYAVHALVDTSRTNSDVTDAFLKMVVNENSDLVMLHLASAMQKAQGKDWWPVMTVLCQRTNLASDRDYPLMLWYALKDRIGTMPREGVELLSRLYSTTKSNSSSQATQASLPPPVAFQKLVQFSARYFASRMQRDPSAIEMLISACADGPSEMQSEVLAGMQIGLQGRHRVQAPHGWEEFAKSASQHPNLQVRETLLSLQTLFGDGVAAEQLAEIVRDKNANDEARRSALESMTESRVENVKELAYNMIRHQALTSQSIATILQLGDVSDAKKLMELYPDKQIFRKGSAEVLLNSLVSRREYIPVLLEAVETGRIDPSMVNASLLRQMQMLDDPSVTAKLAQIWPQTKLIGRERITQMQALEAKLTPDVLSSADLGKGRASWDKLCASCHKLYGQGGLIGPELTGAQRTNLRYLTENIIDPSATVAANYCISLIMIDDGTLVSGVVVAEDDSTISVQTVKERLTIEKASIEQRKASTQSLMPEGLLDALDDDARRDLIAYLMSSRQIEPKKP